MSSGEAVVHISLGEENVRVGKLWFHYRKGRQGASFEYDGKWLEHPEKFALEPALAYGSGRTGSVWAIAGRPESMKLSS